jgi:hypothetical protein
VLEGAGIPKDLEEDGQEKSHGSKEDIEQG